jgi:hypothetical protein
MTLMLQLLIGGTLTGSPGPVALGQDLVAWRALQEQTEPTAWRAFLMEYPNSPLAELAWRRLVEVGHAPDPTANPTLARIAASYVQHEAELARSPEGFAVATLRLQDPPAEAVPSRGTRRVGFSPRAPMVLTGTSARNVGWMLLAEPLAQETLGIEAPSAP